MAIESGGGTDDARRKNGSWAEVLGRSLPNSWNKNVLEIVLEKDFKGPFTVSDNDCARLFKKWGLI